MVKTVVPALPIAGDIVDMADLITGIATGNFSQAALSAVSLLIPGGSLSALKAGKEVIETIGKQSA
jgi:hypothetical protein